MNIAIEIFWLIAAVVPTLVLIGAVIRIRSLQKRNDWQARDLSIYATAVKKQRDQIEEQASEEANLHNIIDALQRKVRMREGRIEDLVRQIAQEQSAYTRHQCTFCGGSGIQQVAGSVHMHPEQMEAEFHCDVCLGDGYLYKRKLEPTAEETENERWARRYEEGAKAAVVSLQTTDPAVLRYAAQEKLDEVDTTDDHRAHWMGFMSKVAEAIDKLEEDMEVEVNEQ